MSPEQTTTPGFWERLPPRWEGRHPLYVVWLTLFLTWPIAGLGAFYLWLNASLNVAQVGLIAVAFLILSLVTIALLGGYASATTRAARAVLADRQAASDRAWQEMGSLARRFAGMSLLANLLVVDLPLLVSARWFGNLDGASFVHLIIAVFLVTIGWTVLAALVLDRALTPLQPLLAPAALTPTDFGLPWTMRLWSVLVTLVLITCLLLGGTLYRRFGVVAGLQEGAAGLLWLSGIGVSVLAILLAFGAAALLARPLQHALDAMKQALWRGLDSDSRLSASAYGGGELSGLALGVRALLERTKAIRQRAEQDLQTSMAEAERRQACLQLAARIGRLALMPQDQEAFLGQVVRILAGHYYHATLFWLEEDGRTLSLRVAAMARQSSPLDPAMTVDVDRRSVVGMAVYLGRAFLENDIRQERSLQSKVTLPSSGAELAVPVRVAGRVTAVLDLQTEQAREFREEDLEALEAIAAQIALVIQNRQLESEYRAATRQIADLTARSVRRAWESRVRRHRRGYRYTPAGVAPVTGLSEEMEPRGNRLDVPIVLRGQRIGSLALARRDDLPWSEAEQTLAVEIAEQVALALENARLLSDAQQRAAQEQMIGELTTRFSRTLEPEALLQEAVSELKRLPNVSEVSVFIQPPEAGDGSGRRTSSRE